MVFYMAASLQ